MTVLINRATFLLSGKAANGVGSAFDMRGALPAAYLVYACAGNSAIFNLEASHDSTGWLTVATYTATATQTGSAQITGFFPYVRGNAVGIYSAAGGSAQLTMHYSPVP